MASAGAAIWLLDTERFFMELSTMITKARQQRNATATQFDSSDFFVRRLEEYERTSSVLTTRIEESYAQEILGSLLLDDWPCKFVTALRTVLMNC